MLLQMKMTIPITTTSTILIIERGKLRLAFVSTKAVLVRKRRQTFGTHKLKAPSGRELAPKATEGERVAIKLV